MLSPMVNISVVILVGNWWDRTTEVLPGRPGRKVGSFMGEGGILGIHSDTGMLVRR